MEDQIKQHIEQKRLFSIDDVMKLFDFTSSEEDLASESAFRQRLHTVAFKEAAARMADEPLNETQLTPEAIYAKFRCDMYMRYMDYIDKGTTMSVEEAERWIDRATEFVTKVQ